ncbi:hypothetical protein [Aurantiacibacter suaedae]|uniref:hypothetical protein n=1 Tax=Aurantiacibacter suaedae TaxID=2545755 RepID=UPI0010F859E9|nr:hypothetical protein [Aurantiacibacter suaedae]
MHRFALALVASLALVSACGGEEPMQDRPQKAGLSELAIKQPAPGQMPSPSAEGVDSVNFSGTYTFIDLDGSRSTLTLDKDAGTYEYVSPDGSSSGKYRRLDASRIAIADLKGSVGYFSIAPGAVYRLSGPSSPFDELDPARMYRRSDYAVEAGPGVATSPVDTSESPVESRGR